MNSSSQELASAISGAGVILLCKSEYSSLKLFKQRTTLFFFVCQITIWSSVLETVLVTLVIFLPKLKLLPMIAIEIFLDMLDFN